MTTIDTKPNPPANPLGAFLNLLGKPKDVAVKADGISIQITGLPAGLALKHIKQLLEEMIDGSSDHRASQ